MEKQQLKTKMNYLRQQALKHKVKHIFSGKSHFFEVKSGKEVYNVSINVSCDCKYMGTQGIANNKMCSHVLAVLYKIIETNSISLEITNVLQKKRNECSNLVRISNRKINEIRKGENEGILHWQEKEIICKKLINEKKQFITEAIFNTKYLLRADILVLDDFKVIEIANTETEKSLSIKREVYKKMGLSMKVIRVG